MNEPVLTIYRGDDTRFNGDDPIKVFLPETMELEGLSASLTFQGLVKTIPSGEIVDHSFGIAFTAAETNAFLPGLNLAVLRLFDSEGRQCIAAKIKVDVRIHKVDDSDVNATPPNTHSVSVFIKGDALVFVPNIVTWSFAPEPPCPPPHPPFPPPPPPPNSGD